MQSRPAAKIYYSVAGRTVLIEAHDDWSSQAVIQLFAGWFLTPIPTDTDPSPQVTISVRCGVPPPGVPTGFVSFEIAHGGICHTDNKTYYLDFERSLVVFDDRTKHISLWVTEPFEINSPQVTQLLSHALSPAMRRCNVFEIHSAGVIHPGSSEAVMIAGPSGSGKSTLTSMLAGNGWSYLSDDILLLCNREGSIEARAFRRFFALTAKTISAVRLSQTFREVDHKQRIVPEEHFNSEPTERAIPRTLVFPRINGEASSRLVALSTGESMAHLIRLSPWSTYDKPTSIEHLKVLGLLANQTRAFAFEGGTDILKDPSLAARLIFDAVSETVIER